MIPLRGGLVSPRANIRNSLSRFLQTHLYTSMEKLSLPESLQNLLTQSRSQTDPSLTWSEAYGRRDFPQALTALEVKLHETPANPSLRLWWVMLQLEMLQVPLTALTSPLLEIYPSIAEDPALHSNGMCALIGAASRLAEKNQLRLGVIMLEHADELAAKSALLNQSQRSDLLSYHKNYLHQEIKRAESKRENRDYLARLKSKEEALAARKPEVVKEKERATTEKKPPLSAKSIFQDAASIPTTDSGAAAAIDAKEVGFDPGHAIRVGGEEKTSNFRSRLLPSALALMFFIALLYGGAKGFGYLFGTNHGADGDLLLAMNTSFAMDREMALPDPQPSSKDKLARRMENLNSNAEQLGEKIKQLDTKSTEQPAQTIEQLSNDPQVDTSALDSKESRKLKNSADDELVSIDGTKKDPSQVSAAPSDPRRTPRLDPKGLSQIPVDELGGELGAHPARRPDLKVGGDGRIYGPPETQDPAQIAGAHDKTLDGAPLRSYEVKEFDQPILFKTIAPTNVLSAPSLLSTAVSHLEANTSIQVISRMGQWLELRSNKGARGYIFAQDAVEAAEQTQ